MRGLKKSLFWKKVRIGAESKSFLLLFSYLKVGLNGYQDAFQSKKKFSSYTGLYDIIVPKDNLLRQIKNLIDFSFIYDELLVKYCHADGHPTKPENIILCAFSKHDLPIQQVDLELEDLFKREFFDR